VNVVDLMKLQPHSEHPHGLSDADFDALFTIDRPVIFAFHGYPWADPTADLPKGPTTRIYMSGDIKKKGQLLPPSIWLY